MSTRRNGFSDYGDYNDPYFYKGDESAEDTFDGSYQDGYWNSYFNGYGGYEEYDMGNDGYDSYAGAGYEDPYYEEEFVQDSERRGSRSQRGEMNRSSRTGGKPVRRKPREYDEYDRRRANHKAKREQELQRKKRRVITLVAVAAAVVLIVWALPIIQSTVSLALTMIRGREDTSSEQVIQIEDDGLEEETPGAELLDAVVEETAEEEEETSLPYVYYETENTISLGESPTDIHYYDNLRGITTTEEETQEEESQEEEESQSEDSQASLSATEYVDSQYAILVNIDTGEIVATRNAYEQIVPASMTKVMTILVAVEALQAMGDIDAVLQDTFTITQEICDEAYLSGSSFVGYGVGDEAVIEDLLYGTILPSGADAAMGLAEYVAGSQEAFVEMMNQKCEELGIAQTTHFTNVIGLYDEENYSTTYDMCVIMNAAIENDLCREVLSMHTWTTQGTMDNPEGITISNWFLRRIEDHDSNGLVLCGKTGYVNESGYCAVSYLQSNGGGNYIACTAMTYNTWRCIYDHIAIYSLYTE